VAAKGSWGTVEWALDSRGRMPARVFFEGLEDEDKAKLFALFGLLAETGRINNREKFRALGDSGPKKYAHLKEFKSFQLRFVGDFRPGGRFLIAEGLWKQTDKHKSSDLDRALRILEENDLKEGGAE